VERVILQALAKHRSDRYEKVVDLVNDFKRAWLTKTDKNDISSTTLELPGLATLLSENGNAFPLAEKEIVLGRNSVTQNIKNDIDLSDLDTKKIVSRRHAVVKRQQDEFILCDLGSRNGTFINGERVSSTQSHTLVSGDVIEFGSGGVKLTFIK
jgi:pSer/pThr/pTyr-binding forkhead associated (FHA) protein